MEIFLVLRFFLDVTSEGSTCSQEAEGDVLLLSWLSPLY